MNDPKAVVVMFTDLVRSTELLVTQGAQVLAGTHLDRQVTAVTDAGGTVVQVEGDGVMATFSSAAGAVAAAQALQQAVDGASTSDAVGGRVTRIGISAGDAVEHEGNLFSAAVVEAARLCAIAEGGQILAAQVVWLMTSPDARTRWRALGDRTLKGLPDPIQIYEVPWQPSDTRPIGVVVADDSGLLRSGIARLLTDSGLRVLGEATDAEELMILVGALNPDVIIVDIRMPPTFTLEGIRAAEAIRASHPHIGILVLSQHVEPRDALGLLNRHDHGIGYLLKDRVGDLDDFIEAVNQVARGGTAIDPEIVAVLLDKPRRDNVSAILTARECDVLSLMAEGRSNRAIGARLGLGARTVEAHIASILTKLGLQPEEDDHRRVLAVLTYLKNT